MLHQGWEEATLGSFPHTGRQSGCSGGTEPCSTEQRCRRMGREVAGQAHGAAGQESRAVSEPGAGKTLYILPRCSGLALLPPQELRVLSSAAGHCQGG